MKMLLARMPSPIQRILLLMKVTTKISKNKKVKKRKKRPANQRLSRTPPPKVN